MNQLSRFEQITFEEATRILYFIFSRNPRIFQAMMEDLMTGANEPARCITSSWYDQYREFITDNKKSK